MAVTNPTRYAKKEDQSTADLNDEKNEISMATMMDGSDRKIENRTA